MPAARTALNIFITSASILDGMDMRLAAAYVTFIEESAMPVLFRCIAVSAAVLAVPVWSLDNSPAVAVTGGRIQGSVLERGGAVFKGIPFAQPPVEVLRWREPRPVKPWTGLRSATSFGAPCSQNSNGRVLETSSEDCLYLNVWTPEWPPRARKPVMFWMHGGGNYAGATGSPNFDGESLARKGVVLVSAAYRLTAFGFFAHPELTGESPHHASGNYGLMDQIAALQWVRANIARLGGDPGNVTIFGQSAGAVDATVLMTSPLAAGLFHKVIAESGTVTRNPDPGTLAMTALGPMMAVKSGDVTYSDAPALIEAEKNGEELAHMLQAPVTDSLRYLRSLPAADILKATASPRNSIGPANGIVVDGWVLPRAPAEVFATGHEHRVPLLAGNNARERTPPRTTPEELIRAMEAMYGPLAPRAGALYTTPDPLYGDAASQWVVDSMYRCPVVAELFWHVVGGNPAWEYQFDRAPVGREALGAVHGAEVPYVFGTLNSPAEVDRRISDAVQEYWTNFARTGNPNGSTIKAWREFSEPARSYLEFTSDGPVPAEGLRQPFCALYIENVKRLMKR
jgi:para-nitrobenzyl esterase